MTIEDLAKITYKGFRDSDKRFEGVDKRFDELAAALTSFARMTEENFRHVNSRLDQVRHDISDVPTMREELRHFRTRLDRIERKV